MSAVEDAALLEEVAQIRVEMRANEAAAAENGEAKQGFDATPAKLSKLKVCARTLLLITDSQTRMFRKKECNHIYFDFFLYDYSLTRINSFPFIPCYHSNNTRQF